MNSKGTHDEEPGTVDKGTDLVHLKCWHKEFARAGTAKKVAIIGAGMSGLICGWLLTRAGHDVTIYEASNTVGGRVKTLRASFSDGLYAEAGAMRVPDSHKLTHWLMGEQAFNFSLLEFKQNDSDNNFYYINGHRSSMADHDSRKNGHFHRFNFPLKRHERTYNGARLFERALVNYINTIDSDSFEQFKRKKKWKNDIDLSQRLIEGICQDLTSPAPSIFPIAAAELDRISLREFLIERAYFDRDKKEPISQAGQDMISAVLAFETQLSCSMLSIVSDYGELMGNQRLWQIKGGMDYLPKAFAGDAADAEMHPKFKSLKKLGYPDLVGKINYGARVRKIDGYKGGYRINFEWTASKNQLNHHKIFDVVVIALPFGALRRMYVNHENRDRDVAKWRAIRQLHYDNACKVIVELCKEFWSDAAPKFNGGHSITDLSVRQIYYPMDSQFPERDRKLLLASYTWGDDSLRWTSLSHENRIRYAIQDVIKCHHGHTSLNAEKYVVGGTSHSWAEDEFTVGAFAMFEPYQLTTLFRDVWKREGNIHYCGEHTSRKHGWIEGAIESGIRVARNICRDAGTRSGA